MYAPYPENMMESIKKVEATRAQRMATEPRRLTADEKDALLKKFHPDYNPDAFAEIKVGPNKGQKAPLELAEMLHSESRLMNEKIDLNKIDYDVDVLVIGGGGAGSSCAIEAHNAGANVMIVTKLRIGDANTMMAEGGIQAADKENDSPVQHYLDAFGGGHFAARPELLKKLEKKGFVTCRTSEKDHRCKVVSAAERAHELHHAIGVFDDRVFTALCRGLSEGEIAEFLRITDVMLENAKNMNDAREPFPCGRGCDAE